MLQSATVMAVAVLTGYCIWVRRRSWRYRWDATITLSVALQGTGFILTAPFQMHYLAKWLFALTGHGHLRDWAGHMCFMSSASALVYAAAYRLATREEVERFMRRIEIPGAAAALIMLTTVLCAEPLDGKYPTGDFIDVHTDGWLKLYWLTYVAILIYLLWHLIYLLHILREDPRSRRSSNFYIAATYIGFTALAALLAHTVLGVPIPLYWIWAPLFTASGIAICVGAWSWHRNTRAGCCPEDPMCPTDTR